MSTLASRPTRAAGEFAMPPAFAAFDQAGQPALTRDLADEIAQRVAAHLNQASDDPWLDSKAAAEHLGITQNSLWKLSAARKLPASQDCDGGKLYFRRSDLDRWRLEQSHDAR